MIKLSSVIKAFSNKKPSLLNINLLNYYGNHINIESIKRQSIFLQSELLTRLSQRVINLINLPYGLPKIHQIQNVIHLYTDSFNKINDAPLPTKETTIKTFTHLISNIRKKHSNVDQSISLGLKQIHPSIINYPYLNGELDKFFLSRISIRLLIAHQEAIVFHNTNCIMPINIVEIIKTSIEDIQSMCFNLYDTQPTIQLNIVSDNNNDIFINHYPSYIYYPIIEVLKNSIVAHALHDCLDLPITITLSETEKSIYIKINDQGKGFHFEDIPKVLSYSYTTSELSDSDYLNDQFQTPIISGFGFGLPMAKLYCKYFGGDLTINPVENIGTDVNMYFDKLGEKKEILF